MFRDNDSVARAEASAYEPPPPPRFYARASAAAQPVQPLQRSAPARWLQRARDARRTLTPRTKLLVFVIVAGLLMGAASGALLAKRNDSVSHAAVIEESRIEAAAAGQTIEQTPTDSVTTPESSVALSYPSPSGRIRRYRALRRHGAPGAYRFAVIK